MGNATIAAAPSPRQTRPGTIRAMKRSSLLACTIGIAIAIVAPTASAASTPLESLAGTWSGSLDGASPKIAVALDLTGQWNGSRIALTGKLDCSGPLTFVGSGTSAYRFIERITQSASSSCTLARGRVRLTPLADGRLGYSWTLFGGAQHATATLSRSLT